MVTSSAPSSFDCTATSIAVMPPPITTTRRPTGSLEVLRLAQLGDIVDRILNALGVFILGAQRIDALQADAEEHRVIIRLQVLELQSLAERLAILDGDAADGEDEVHFPLREVIELL